MIKNNVEKDKKLHNLLSQNEFRQKRPYDIVEAPRTKVKQSRPKQNPNPVDYVDKKQFEDVSYINNFLIEILL